MSTGTRAPTLKLPKGWTTLNQKKIAEERWLSTVQTPRKSRTQKYEIEAEGAKVEVELVTRVK